MLLQNGIYWYKTCSIFSGNEGRAGMAAIANDSGLDLNVVSKGLQSKLPPYARPVFIRLLEKVDTTGKYRIS